MFRKRWIWVLAGGVLVAGFAAYRLFSGGEQAAARYETVAIDRGDIVARVTASGTVSALVTVQVGSQVSGRIQDILADFNDPVQKNQVLARIDPRFYQAALEQAEANVQVAQGAKLKAEALSVQAQRSLERSKGLAERNVLSVSDLDVARANAAAARAEVRVAEGVLAQARAALNQARVNLGYTTIVSPIRGIVISRSVDVGQTVAASLQAPTLFTIAEDLRRMQVDTNVAEADIGKLRPDMPADFTVDAFPGDAFQGKVRQIRIAPQVVQNVVTYNAVIDVDNPELKLRPGMTANVTFIFAERKDVLRVPNVAARFRPPEEWLTRPPSADGKAAQAVHDGKGPAPVKDGAARPAAQAPALPRGAVAATDRRTVWVLRGETPAAVPIRIGVTDGSFTEVLEGNLKEGYRAITDVQLGAGSRPGFMPRIF